MGSSRPFRFGVINERMQMADAWVRQAQETEKLGYSTFLVRDHFAPFSALMAAANVTKTMRVGSLVIDNDYRHPVVLAKEAATLDLLSGGRFELGLGAGFLKTEYDMAGMTFDPPGVRISRLTEALEVLRAGGKGHIEDMASQWHHGSATVCPAGWRAASGRGVGVASRCRWIGIPLRTQHQPSSHPQCLVGNERQTG